MATCSSILAWRIPGTGEPGGLPSMGSHRVGHDWSNLAIAVAAFNLEKEMATHSNILAYIIPWTGEPGGLLYMGSHRVGHNWNQLACLHALEKEMAAHSSVLAWRIPGTEEPVGLPSMGSHRVRHNWSNLAAAAAAFNLSKKGPKSPAPFNTFKNQYIVWQCEGFLLFCCNKVINRMLLAQFTVSQPLWKILG